MENGTNHLVFLYGTLRKGEPNYHELTTKDCGGKALFIGLAKTVKKWPLVIASRYNIPYVLYCEGTGHNIIGEIYEVDDQMLLALDKFENHPNYYRREVVEVEVVSEEEVDKKILKPWIYFLKNFKPDLLKLPFLPEYSSKGSHGLEYVSSEETSSTEDV